MISGSFNRLDRDVHNAAQKIEKIQSNILQELSSSSSNNLLSQYLEVCRERDQLVCSKEYYQNLFDHSPIAYFCLDEYGVFTNINQTGLGIFGIDYNDIIGKPAILRVNSLSRRVFMSHIQKIRSGKTDTIEIEVDTETGSIPVLLKSIPVPIQQGEHHACQCAMVDISQRKRTEDELTQTKDDLEHLAHHDALTGLPNRLLFQDRLQQAILRSVRSKKLGALAFLDLDHFKNINDTLGHQVGDEILRQVAHRLQQCTRDEDTVCRIGGDEFTIILENVTSLEHVAQTSKKLIEAFRPSFYVFGEELHIKTSIGISLFPRDSENKQEIIKAADIAMYEAKAEGRNNFKLYDDNMRKRIDMRMELENGLFKAIEKNELILHFQPIYSDNAKKIKSFEALLRWQKSATELIYPDEFIPIAEETDLISEIGDWVIRAVCLQINAWKESNFEFGEIAINISARQFNDRNFVDNVETTLAETNVDASHLEFELTESTVMADPIKAIAILDKLRDMGIRITIDDFGTGYSSLSHIKRFPIQRLKIDASFVRSIPDDKNDCAIASAIISMAHQLELDVVSEGIETIEQFNFLKENNCNLFQGNYLGSPMPSEMIENRLMD